MPTRKKATKKSTTKKSAARKSAKKRTAKKTTAKKSGAKKTAGAGQAKKSAPLEISTESLPDFFVGQSKKTRIKADGGTPPYSFALTQGSLPGGLNFNSKGRLWGTPLQAGMTTIFVTVTDAVGDHQTQAFDLEIESA